jgi:ABC-type sugar transport system ATPase subunit
MPEKLLEIKNISKRFPGVEALRDVSFDIQANTVHCIVGENGAGKSTLIKILTGAERRSGGTILFHGKEFAPRSTREAMHSGMSVLFQELNVVNQLTVEQNLMLGKESVRLGFFRRDAKTVEKVFAVLASLDPHIGLHRRVADLSVAQKQVVEIAKAIASRSNVIIMDEPTAALSEDEVKRLFAIIKELKKQNVTVIYISHRLREIFEIGDAVTVLRDGQMIGTREIAELTSCRDEVESCAELIKMMLGKVVAEKYIAGDVDRGEKVLEMRGVSTEKLKDVSFALHKGEILGFYGLIGSGKTEIARALYGLDAKEGAIAVHGRPVSIDSPKDAIDLGIALVPEERRSEGLFTKLSIRENIPLMNIRSISRWGIFSGARERQLARSFIGRVKIVARDENHVVEKLSGGNQQKVVLSKCINADSRVLLMDEPTRGIDVGAKEEIHNLIREIARSGTSVIVFTSELPEVLNLCDRIILLFDGRIREVIDNGQQVDSERIMHVVTGGMEALQ